MSTSSKPQQTSYAIFPSELMSFARDHVLNSSTNEELPITSVQQTIQDDQNSPLLECTVSC